MGNSKVKNATKRYSKKEKEVKLSKQVSEYKRSASGIATYCVNKLILRDVTSINGCNVRDCNISTLSIKYKEVFGRSLADDYTSSTGNKQTRQKETRKEFFKTEKAKTKTKIVVKKANLSTSFDSIKFVEVNFSIEWAEQYNHPNWQRMRSYILNRDEFKCTKCGDEHTLLHVHHKRYSKGFVWQVEPKYLITLCDKCHAAIHNKKQQS